MTLAVGLAWQANFVRERKAVLARARDHGVQFEFRGEPTLLRCLMGDRIVWSFSIPLDSEFYGHTTELRRAFPEAYINHLGPMTELGQVMPDALMLDLPPTSPPLRSAWWGF